MADVLADTRSALRESCDRIRWEPSIVAVPTVIGTLGWMHLTLSRLQATGEILPQGRQRHRTLLLKTQVVFGVATSTLRGVERDLNLVRSLTKLLVKDEGLIEQAVLSPPWRDRRHVEHLLDMIAETTTHCHKAVNGLLDGIGKCHDELVSLLDTFQVEHATTAGLPIYAPSEAGTIGECITRLQRACDAATHLRDFAQEVYTMVETGKQVELGLRLALQGINPDHDDDDEEEEEEHSDQRVESGEIDPGNKGFKMRAWLSLARRASQAYVTVHRTHFVEEYVSRVEGSCVVVVGGGGGGGGGRQHWCGGGYSHSHPHSHSYYGASSETGETASERIASVERWTAALSARLRLAAEEVNGYFMREAREVVDESLIPGTRLATG